MRLGRLRAHWFIRRDLYDHPLYGHVEIIHRRGQLIAVHHENTDGLFKCMVGFEAAMFLQSVDFPDDVPS